MRKLHETRATTATHIPLYARICCQFCTMWFLPTTVNRRTISDLRMEDSDWSDIHAKDLMLFAIGNWPKSSCGIFGSSLKQPETFLPNRSFNMKEKSLSRQHIKSSFISPQRSTQVPLLFLATNTLICVEMEGGRTRLNSTISKLW